MAALASVTSKPGDSSKQINEPQNLCNGARLQAALNYLHSETLRFPSEPTECRTRWRFTF